MDDKKVIASALRCLECEREGLDTLVNLLKDNNDPALQDNFVKAVNIISQMKGRVVLTGVGKSGHIGSKIAATLASTGTPALFVHAAEANHGDLGMISDTDVILALSWSGETIELGGIINHATRFKIPLIAITSGSASCLSKHADIVLLLPKVKEACPNGLAPTTSTMLQLAIGDALSMALLELRGFTGEDFKIFHPGGSLGAQLKHTRDVMHSGDKMPIVKLGTLMPEAMRILSKKHFGCVLVVDDNNKLLGIITEGDLARNIHRDISKLMVDAVMTRDPKVISPDSLLSHAASLIQQHQISALAVVDCGRPIGIIHFHDLLHFKVI